MTAQEIIDEYNSLVPYKIDINNASAEEILALVNYTYTVGKGEMQDKIISMLREVDNK